ncbi:MAG TPA: 2-C-methyl-D-erythritol 4-phosphate cytidylyltransferase [Methylomusa anaerophila]|uniref:Bifunctional enzyme IspD/IspF n=2 Tax=Methylomusa anaerophila TaxID=1930071 RepID=A0A348AJS7_9FIRM|nr:2-C-methyl-D-erythritol 4-phosphate cytidylyltransferase [Methylomusa anaerophila]BBB91325.1 bifunctional enzyme IspD/IspF [Methylomusa anaerophila]HML90500.1 2-C-methyl-D-erythritol 4-phosphate cytidylyltransferase [Methylomusa anaerophila]
MVTAIITAAGQGRRMGAGFNKVLMPLGEHPVLVHTLSAVAACADVNRMVVTAAADEIEAVKSLIVRQGLQAVCQVVAGGNERQYSIDNALSLIPEDEDIILVHDGARPLIDPQLIKEVIAAALVYQAAVLAVPVKDTIKTVNNEKYVTDTLERSKLWAIQTPQAFHGRLLKEAYCKAKQEEYLGTDDASLVERIGIPVKIVAGSYRNIKITTPEDLIVADALLNAGQSPKKEAHNRMQSVRVGIGYDVHRLTTGRKLILGGVEIPHTHGLEGHSDADVLLHAIKDALLGAAALGDIGRHFPDSDDQYKGASSLALLEKVRNILFIEGYRIINIDATIVAQQPKLAPYMPAMNINVASVLNMGAGQVNIKATTTEGLGFAGRREGIAAYATVSIIRGSSLL